MWDVHVVIQGLLFQNSAASDFYKIGEVGPRISESFAWGTSADQSRKHRYHGQGKWVLWYQPGRQQSVSRSEGGKSGMRVSQNLNRHKCLYEILNPSANRKCSCPGFLFSRGRKEILPLCNTVPPTLIRRHHGAASYSRKDTSSFIFHNLGRKPDAKR